MSLSLRLTVTHVVPKGSRDTKGRFIKPGVRLKIVRPDDLGYDKAMYGLAFYHCMPRFKIKKGKVEA